MIEKNELKKYEKYYSESGLTDKLLKVAKSAGVKVVYAVLLLYFVAVSPSTSLKDKAIIYGALGYFILPVDLIPDVIATIGYADDMTALVMVLKAVWNNITPDVEDQAYRKLTSWFGEVEKSELKLF